MRGSFIASGLALRIPARTGGLDSGEIALPQLVLAHAEVVEIIPRVDAGIVAIRERRPYRVMADGLETGDRHVALADLERFLARTVSPHFGGGRVHAQ